MGSQGRDRRRAEGDRAPFRFFTFDDGQRGIDFTLAFTPAGNDRVTFGDTKEAGLCAVRVAKSISDKPDAHQLARPVGREAGLGQAGGVVRPVGMVNGTPHGVAVLDHPENLAPPRHLARPRVRPARGEHLRPARLRQERQERHRRLRPRTGQDRHLPLPRRPPHRGRQGREAGQEVPRLRGGSGVGGMIRRVADPSGNSAVALPPPRKHGKNSQISLLPQAGAKVTSTAVLAGLGSFASRGFHAVPLVATGQAGQPLQGNRH